MCGSVSKVEWQVAGSEEEWTRMHFVRPTAPRGASAWRGTRLIQWVGASVLVLILLVWVRHDHLQRRTHLAEQQRIQTDLETALRRAVEPGGFDSMAYLQAYGDPQTPPAWRDEFAREDRLIDFFVGAQAGTPRVTLQTMELQEDRAWVRAVLSAADDETAAVRVVHFYRRTDDGWLRTVPDVALWGEPQTQETAYFRFEFRQNDAAAIRAVADEVDARYRTLRRDLGLPLPVSGADKIVLKISPAAAPLPNMHMIGGGALPNGALILLPSPALQPAPLHLAESTILAQSLGLLLGETVLDEWTRTRLSDRDGLDWTRLVPALRLWQLWDRDDPLSLGRRELVRWLYTNTTDARRDPAQLLSRSAEQMCTTGAVWNLSPDSLAIPLPCSDQDPLHWYANSAPVHVRSMLRYLPEISEASNASERHSEIVALITMIEYVVAVHGREQLPVLLDGFGYHGSWDTLIPALFGLSVAEFEAGWWEYLAAEYGVEIP